MQLSTGLVILISQSLVRPSQLLMSTTDCPIVPAPDDRSIKNFVDEN
jgi:hypothetical protein